MPETTVRYAEGFVAKRNEVPRGGTGGYSPGQGASGYGSRISTDYMIHFPGDPSHRWYRVYCMCYSNSGTCYVRRRGEMLVVRETDLEVALEKSEVR